MYSASKFVKHFESNGKQQLFLFLVMSAINNKW